MSFSWTIDNMLRESHEIRSRSELEKVLDRLASIRCEPVVVYRLVKDDRDLMYFGVGAPETRLDYTPDDPSGPYYGSIGNPEREGEVLYSAGGEITESPLRSQLPWSVAREALLEFYDTGGKLPSKVRWEEV